MRELEREMAGRAGSAVKAAIGCVAENTPKYLAQALRLLQSVRWFGGSLNDFDFHVCVVDGVDPGFRLAYQNFGAEVHVVPRFSERHPQSNKLRFLQIKNLQECEQVLLLDCDTLVLRDPVNALLTGEFSAKIADVASVPLDTLRKVFVAFDLITPEPCFRCTASLECTIPYFNAGVLAFSRSAMTQLVPRWIEFTERLIDSMHLLGPHYNFCEQVSLSLALTDTRSPFHVLGNECNFPSHFEGSGALPGLQDVDPFIVHYHWRVDPNGNVLTSGYPAVDKRIAAFNIRLRDYRERGESTGL